MTTAAEDTAKKIEDMTAETQKSVNVQMEKMAKSFEDMAAFNQESVDAVISASNVAMKAAEEINAEMMAYSKKSLEESVAAAKDFASSKSLTELLEKQTEFAKTSFDGFVKQASKMNEMALAAAKNSMEPISARVAAAGDMAKSHAA